ncbi:WLM domain-domain-containing protein [Catenaria anguillulae PL171]|uniref:WLM domain-domain-containing protein n=1 Tax=Catenaria anguillulae PL171 TaxID=765915 RepID=A0A1Y2HGW1_9FUNG|nr:WLM domain-domain-containing protein [Catenaria anguillulae PL171]
MDCDCTNHQHDHHPAPIADPITDSAGVISLAISFQRRQFDLDGIDPGSTTVLHVKESVAEWSGIPIDGQKLVFKGKILANDATLANVGLVAATTPGDQKTYKLMLTGSSSADVQKIQNLRVRQPFKPPAYTPVAAARAQPRDLASISGEHQYTFHEISVLALPMADQARSILERLRDDQGIRGIMQQNKWAVGRLIELSPTEHTILGYNQNKGATIALRLRTSDFSGFRHFDSIRKVLLHELAHMVWSEHDENFHALNRKLNKDLVAFDWTRRGNRLNEEVSSVSVFGHSIFDDEEEGSEVDGGGYVGGAFVLGGGTVREAEAGEQLSAEKGL